MNKHKLRILISSNAMWSPSGYAQQIAEFVPLIRDEGYPIACINFHGQEGGWFDHEGIRMYPRMGDSWGSDALIHHSKHFNADVSFTLQDIWVLDPGNLKQVGRWIPIVPIDHEPVPPAIRSRLDLAYRVVSYSKFGHDELKRTGLHSTYIPHTVNTEVFKPMGRDSIREGLGIPKDVFLFGMVAANKDNPPRKSFQEAMDAFKMFHDEYPNSAMYFHVMLNQAGGFPIQEYAKVLNIEKSIYFTPPYQLMYDTNKEDMAKLYNTFDCLLCPSTNEGFGVPIIEAQSCGVPVITNNFTAMPELIAPENKDHIVEVATRRFTPLLSFIGIPDTKSIYKVMKRIYKGDRKLMSENARKHIVNTYDTKRVFNERWIPFLEKLEKEIYPEIDNHTAKE